MKKFIVFVLSTLLLFGACNNQNENISFESSVPDSNEPSSSEENSDSSNDISEETSSIASSETQESSEEVITSAKERYEIFMSYEEEEIGYFIGTAISIEQYPYNANANVFFMDGIYGYYAINLPVSETPIEIGMKYMICGFVDITPEPESLHRLNAKNFNADSIFRLSEEYLDYCDEPIIENITENIEDISINKTLASVDVDGLTITDISKLGNGGTSLFTAKLNENTYYIYCNGSLIGGNEMINRIKQLGVGTKINLRGVIVITEFSFRAINQNMIIPV